MPLYSSRCEACGSPYTYYQTVANRANTPLCCNAPTTKTPDAPMVAASVWTGHKGFTAYNRNGSHLWIESGQDYSKFLKANDFIPESEGKREAEIKAAHREAAEDQKLAAAVETAVMAHTR